MKLLFLPGLLAGVAMSTAALAADPAMPPMGAGPMKDASVSTHMDDMRMAPPTQFDLGFGPGVSKLETARLTAAAASGKLSKSLTLAAQYALGSVSPGGPNASVQGYFDPPVTWPIIGLHAILLPDGRVLNYGSTETGAQGAELVYDVWTPALGVGANAHNVLPNTTTTDIFCSFQSLIWWTGQVLITGGDLTVGGVRNFSNNATTIFTPQTNTLSSNGAMTYPRWYPTVVDMPNGDMVTLGGRVSPTAAANIPEVFNPVTGWRTLTGAASPALFLNGWFYPKAFLTASGNIYIVPPSGAISSLTEVGAGTIETIWPVTGPSSIQLPTIQYAPGMLLRLLASGGVNTVNINGSVPVTKPTSPLDQLRLWSTATVLANGEVLVTGGSTVDNALINVDYTAEIWNPATGAWTAGAQAKKPRLYHSIALLLPDGTVLTAAGGAPGPIAELNAEIYYPPYLYLNDGSGNPAPRPTLVSAPTTIAAGGAITATVGSTDTIGQVTFLRTGSVTHATNIDQNFFNLPFTQQGTTITATLPSNPNVLQPGYYMLFVWANGVPSVSQIIQVTPS